MFVMARHENLLDLSILLCNKISWTLSTIKTSDLVDATEAMKTNSRVTSSSYSWSYALKNNPTISLLIADFASLAKITKSTALTIVDMNFCLRWELRETITEFQESEES